MPHCSRKQTTCSWSLTSSASILWDGRRMTLPLGWLLLCSWVIIINPAFISCFELWMEVSFLFSLFFCTKHVGFVSGHIPADRNKFCSNLPQIFGLYVITYYIMCLECWRHHQIYKLLISDLGHIFSLNDGGHERSKPLVEVCRLETWIPFNACTLLMVSS